MKKRKKKTIIIFLFIIILTGSILFIFLNNTKEIKNKELKVNKVADTSLSAKLKNEKYYIENNLDRYLKYAGENTDLELSKIIADVNSNLDKTKYEDTEKTNIKDNNLMIVKKYYYLT